MEDIKQYSLQADLALAAYATLSSGNPNTANLKAIGMSTSQAIDFAKRWTVVAQYTHSETKLVIDAITGEEYYDTSSNGLSATVFENIETKQRYLAIRGTEFGMADLVADAILATGFSPSVNPQFISLRAQVQGWLDAGVLQPGFSVAGHSLGGYLAAATGVWFANSGGVYMYNAPGIGGVVGNAYNAFRSAFGLGDRPLVGNLYNFRGSEGISIITGLGAQLAPPTLIQIEAAAGGILGPGNHSVVRLVDAFLLYSLYATLAPALSLDQISTLLKSASSESSLTLEGALDTLRILILGKPAVDAAPTKEGSTDNRESLYANLYALRDSSAYKGLSGSAAVRLLATESAEGLVTRAKSDFGSFVALRHLLPVSIDGAISTLSGVHADLYAAWQADRALTPEQRSKGEGNYSDAWLADRAAYLTWLLRANSEDLLALDGKTTFDGSKYGYRDLRNWEFSNLDADPAQNRQILVKGSMLGGTNKIVFGSDGDDADLTGGTGDDRLYGDSGVDTLTGNAGNDYLEGGAGADRYVFSAGQGDDTVVDSDGQGSVVVGEFTLAGSDKGPQLDAHRQTVWKDDNDFEFRLLDERDGQGTLQISGGGLGGGRVFVRNYDLDQGRLGINLKHERKLALAGADASNPFLGDPAGSAAPGVEKLIEGGGLALKTFLNQAAQAGDKLVLSLSGLGDKIKAVLGDRVVGFDGGAVEITLSEGQTDVAFALLSQGDVDDDQPLTLTATYRPASAEVPHGWIAFAGAPDTAHHPSNDGSWRQTA